jgi:hypothetical protein
MKRSREFIEMTFVWKDKRRKKHIAFLELKETRLINQFADSEEVECIEVRVKEHFGTREEFEEINFG